MNQYAIVVTDENDTAYVVGPFQSEQALNTAMTRIRKYNDGSWDVRWGPCLTVDDLIDEEETTDV